MTDQELIQVLRSCGLSNGGSLGRHMGIMDIAADALEALQAENAELKNELDQEHERYIYTLGERDAFEANTIILKSVLSKVEAERDKWRDAAEEAADDFADYVTSGVTNPAPYCANKTIACVDGRGWCVMEHCGGFFPKAVRAVRKEEKNESTGE